MPTSADRTRRLALCALSFLPGGAHKTALAAALARPLDRRLPRGWRP